MVPVKRLTIIFVPHEEAKFRKIGVAVPLLWLLGIGFIFVFVASIYLSLQFFHSQAHMGSMKQMQEKNLTLTRKIATYENHLALVEKQMQKIEQETQSLALMSDFQSEGIHEGLGGVGGMESAPVDRVSSVVLWQKKLLKSLNQLAENEKKITARLRSTPTLAPVKGIPTAGFGVRMDPFFHRREMHPALDISCARGEPVIAPGDGIIVKAGYEGGYGKLVRIFHGRGIVTLYAHLARTSVVTGQKIRRGDLIGYVGSTGRSTGPHLHYEVRVDGRPVDPTAYILDSL